jgi:hypothetical protein
VKTGKTKPKTKKIFFTKKIYKKPQLQIKKNKGFYKAKD